MDCEKGPADLHLKPTDAMDRSKLKKMIRGK